MTANVVGAPFKSDGTVHFATGKIVTGSDTAVAVTITPGFTPRVIRVLDHTNAIMWDWTQDMAATHTIKTVLAVADDTTTAISVPADGGGAPAKAFLLSAGLCAASSTLVWAAWG